MIRIVALLVLVLLVAAVVLSIIAVGVPDWQTLTWIVQ